MNRIIGWKSYELDEIELVYEKAEENSSIGGLMEQLETQALSEARANVGMLKTKNNEAFGPEQFDEFSDSDKETVISELGNIGLELLNTDLATATINIKLSYLITKSMACTIFSILNRLEKLDGTANRIFPNWTLNIKVPIGGGKGLARWEFLIIALYPWLSVRKETVNELAASDIFSTDV